MKRWSLICLVIAALAWAGAAQAQGWIKFAPGDGKYSIDMPGTPKEVRQTALVAGQVADLHQYAVQLGDSEGFITTYSDLRAAPSRAPADLMAEMQGSVQASFKDSKLGSEKAVQFGKYPGRLFRLQLADGTIYSQQIAIVGSRIYQNIAVTTAGHAGDSRVQHFFESFNIAKP